MATQAQVDAERARATSNPPYSYVNQLASELQQKVDRGEIPPEIQEVIDNG